ncbi:MAG: polysaccharide biosynthesis/export family protein, partial [Fibrobacterota bacterium]
PVLGEIEVNGLTPAQLQKVMEEKLAPYINNVVVSIGIEAYFSNKIFVIGEVFRAGEYQIFQPIDILKALALAGGLKSKGVKELRIVRSNGEVLTVDFKKFFQKKSQKEWEEFTLYPGDTLYVPEAFKFNWSLLTTILSIINISVNIWVVLGR